MPWTPHPSTRSDALQMYWVATTRDSGNTFCSSTLAHQTTITIASYLPPLARHQTGIGMHARNHDCRLDTN